MMSTPQFPSRTKVRARIALRVGASVACLLSASAFLAANRIPQNSSVPLLRLDVVVTDDLGRAVPGLRASEFAVREDGRFRPIEAAEFRSIPSDNFTAVPPILSRADEEREARQPGTRVFAFLLDEFHVRPGVDSHAVRDVIASFIDEKMFARDLAVVARPLDEMESLRFTRDRATLLGNVAAFNGRKGRHAPGTPREAALIGSDPDAVAATRERVVKAGLRDLAERLATLDADRAVIVLVSEGFTSRLPVSPTSLAQSLESSEPDLARVVAASSRFHFPVYVFEPAPRPAVVGEPAEDTATLRWLADRTGGLFISAENAIAGFAKVFHDTHGYYALRYRPAHADGRLHDIEIVTRDKRPHRGPSIYWATGDETPAARERSTAADWPWRRELRRSPLIDAWAGLRVDDAGRAQMTVTWEPRPGQPARAGRVVVSARTATGVSLFENTIQAVGTRGPAIDRATFEVPPGRIELDLDVLDETGRSLDRDVRDVDVPDLSPSGQPGPVLLPVEVLCLRSGRAPETTPRSNAIATYAARGCSRASRLVVRVPAGDASGTPVRITARLLNRAGQTMRALEADPAIEGPTQFSLPLMSLAPGQYGVEVTGENRYDAVSERVTFRVEG